MTDQSGASDGWSRQDWVLWGASMAAVAVGAAIWLLGSVAVAFPGELLTASFADMFTKFFHSTSHPISVIFLLAIDIVIANLFLRESRVLTGFQGGRLGIALGAIILYSVVAMALPVYNATVIASHTVMMGCVAYFLIGIPRAMSYGAPLVAKRV